MHRILSISVLFAFFGSLPAATPTPAEVAASIEAVTGAHTKVVWEQSHSTTGEPKWDAHTSEYRLVGLDTRGSKAGQVVTIIEGPTSVWNPWITYDGNRIIYTQYRPDGGTHRMRIVNWDGQGDRPLADGLGLCYWRDQATGKEWMYFGPKDTWFPPPIKRFRVDDPNIVEMVADLGSGMPFTVSADGKKAAGESPWPRAGVYDLVAKTFSTLNEGCNTRIAPDNSYRWFHYPSGDHGSINLHDANGGSRMLNTTFATDLAGGNGQSWAPRWSSDARFMTVNSPLHRGHIYIAKFKSDYSGFEKHAQVDNITFTLLPSDGTQLVGPQQTYAYAWIDPAPGSSSTSVTPSGLHPGKGKRIIRAPNKKGVQGVK